MKNLKEVKETFEKLISAEQETREKGLLECYLKALSNNKEDKKKCNYSLLEIKNKRSKREGCRSIYNRE